MELKNKKVVFLGDSITEGVGASDLEHRYPNVFEKMSGCEIFVDGIGGTRIAKQRSVSANEKWDLDFISRVPALPADADFVVVFGGTNDFGHGDAPFGTFADRTQETFCGSMHLLCQRLLEKYPYATIVFMTPLHRLYEYRTVNELGNPDVPLIEYVKMIRQICEYYSLPVLDLYKVSGIQPEIEVIRTTYMPDGLHPSNAGAEKIATLLKGFITSL